MASRSNSSLAALLLAQRLVDADAPPLKATEYWALLERIKDPAVLLGRDTKTTAAEAQIDAALAARVAHLMDAATAFAFQLDELEQSGFRVVASVDDEYPARLIQRLGTGAPPMLYVAGETSLLRSDLLGIVGSRDVHPDGAEAAQAAARAAVSHGLGVISGGAKGVDRLAMNAGLEAGGPVVGVLADALIRTARDPDVRRAIGDERACVITPYKPTTGFSVANAMGRNKLIYALSQATLVVSSDLEKGGTWAGAVEALRSRTAPVLVWTGPGAGSGNAALIERGAEAVVSAEEAVAARGPKLGTETVVSAQLALDV